MKYLNKFDSINDFNNYIENTLLLDNWHIKDLPIQERINAIKNKRYYIILKQLANTKEINASELEILSWLDSLNQLYCTFEELNNTHNNLYIFQELEIPFTKKRIDYLLCYEDKILILEFSQTNYNEEELKYDNKLLQAIRYKELLSNILPPNIKIGIHIYLIKNEMINNEIVKQKSKYTNKKEINNFDNQIELYEFLNYFFSCTYTNSCKELEKSLEIINNDFKKIKKALL